MKCTAHIPLPAASWQPDNDNLPRVVAFTGVAGSGKSTAADYLVSRGYTRVKFAAPLKDMMRAIGLTERHIEGDLKEVPCYLLQGKTPRYAMQTIGTEWGRNLIGEDFWIGLWRGRVEAVLDGGGRVVCDDCRFPNESAAIRSLAGDIYRLVGRSANTQAGTHESERMEFDADCLIHNQGTLESLHYAIDGALRRYV